MNKYGWGLNKVPVHFVKGDLFKSTKIKAYAHGCNCAGAMGKGIALRFKDSWPEMYKKYKIECVEGRFCLGDVFTWQVGEYTVFNLGTQSSWRAKAKLSAIESSMAKMLQIAKENDIEAIGMPTIGSGLGGLQWQDVKQIILGLASDSCTNVHLIVFEHFEEDLDVSSNLSFLK